MNCPECGAPSPDDIKICESCGAVIPDAEDRPAEPPRVRSRGQHVAPRKKTKTGLLIGICAIAAVAVAVLIFTFTSGSSGGGGKGYKNYDDLIKDYLVVFTDKDTEKFNGLLFPALLETFREHSYSDSDIVYYIDSWTSHYGNNVAEWNITDSQEKSVSATYLSKIGLDTSQVQSAMDIEVTVRLDGPNSYNQLVIDFDIVSVEDRWYLVEVW